ncbi:MAG: 50S ribosomal protein L10 [Clostridiales bacterium]|jgi:large subunit ribosomal protein L10|nr:50S ribosomal protein L10 [Clostridiales bacterium]
MPKIEAKQVVINEIKEKLEKSQSVVLVDARGITVEQDTRLRKKLRESGIDYKVYKNSLMTFAVENTGFSGLEGYLKGPSTMAFSYDPSVNAAGIIASEMKSIPKLVFKAGIVEGVCYDAAGIEAVSKIPSREELISKLLGSFKSPMSSFARVINAISEKKAEGGSFDAAPAVAEVAVEAPAKLVVEAPAELVVEAPVELEVAPEVTNE